MTYCIAARLDAGLVFLSDSRTDAGVDQIGVFRKLNVFERPDDRVIVIMTSGNLAVSQAVLSVLGEHDETSPDSIWNARTMYQVARTVGEAIRTVHQRDGQALQDQGVDFNVSLIVGGQIAGERCRLFQVYAAGNFIEAHDNCLYFQIGEAKYGKPILDRVLSADTSLDEAAKCALISMDSTLKSNISVGLPLDLLVYEDGALRVSHFANIDENNAYFHMIRTEWGERLKQVFTEIPDPIWTNPAAPKTLVPPDRVHQPVRVTPAGAVPREFAQPQAFAQGPADPLQAG